MDFVVESFGLIWTKLMFLVVIAIWVLRPLTREVRSVSGTGNEPNGAVPHRPLLKGITERGSGCTLAQTRLKSVPNRPGSALAGSGRTAFWENHQFVISTLGWVGRPVSANSVPRQGGGQA